MMSLNGEVRPTFVAKSQHIQKRQKVLQNSPNKRCFLMLQNALLRTGRLTEKSDPLPFGLPPRTTLNNQPNFLLRRKETQAYRLHLHNQNSHHFLFTDFLDPALLSYSPHSSSATRQNTVFTILMSFLLAYGSCAHSTSGSQN